MTRFHLTKNFELASYAKRYHQSAVVTNAI